jgi:hypothetical protein
MCKGYSIIADVQEVRDAYGTGDSPTLYEVDLLQIINDDLEEIEESDLGKFFYDEIIDAAIQSYRSWFNDN